MSDPNPDHILAELQPLFQEALDDPTVVVSRTSNAMNTPNWDSLAHIALIEMIESQFKVRFTLTELNGLKSVGDIVDLIQAKA